MKIGCGYLTGFEKGHGVSVHFRVTSGMDVIGNGTLFGVKRQQPLEGGFLQQPRNLQIDLDDELNRFFG